MTRAERIVAAARSWIGTPYLHQASLKGVGCDCLGLLRGVWREVVGPEPLPVPPYAPDRGEATGRDEMAEAFAQLMHPVPPAEIMAGDVLLFRWRDGLPAKHCAIAASADAMIHAHDGAAVAEAPLGRWWRRHLAGAFRLADGD